MIGRLVTENHHVQPCGHSRIVINCDAPPTWEDGSLRSASVILTSPPLRDGEVRITPAALRSKWEKGFCVCGCWGNPEPPRPPGKPAPRFQVPPDPLLPPPRNPGGSRRSQ